jgi:hypothetical protein
VAVTVLARPAARWMLALAFAVFDPGRPLDPGAAAPAGEPLGEDGSAP